MTERNLVPQLPTNSEEPLPFLRSELKLEIKNIKSLVFMIMQIGGLTRVLRCTAVPINTQKHQQEHYITLEANQCFLFFALCSTATTRHIRQQKWDFHILLSVKEPQNP